MSVAGIDFSTKCLDVVILSEDDNTATHHRRRLDTGPGRALDRTRRVRDALPTRSAWEDSGVVAVAIETPMGQMQGVVPLLLVAGAIIATLPVNLPLELMRSDDWRKRCGLKIRGSRPDLKAASVSFARATWENPPAIFDDNIADAFGIAYAMRELVRAREAPRAA